MLLQTQVRPPVQHKFGCGPLQPGEQPPPVSLFKHRLLQHFMLSLFCKLPVQPMDTMSGMRANFMAKVMLSVLQFRINGRYSAEASPPFISIEMDHSDSAREGCTVSTLTITSEPKDWKAAIQVCMHTSLRAHVRACVFVCLCMCGPYCCIDMYSSCHAGCLCPCLPVCVGASTHMRSHLTE